MVAAVWASDTSSSAPQRTQLNWLSLASTHLPELRPVARASGRVGLQQPGLYVQDPGTSTSSSKRHPADRGPVTETMVRTFRSAGAIARNREVPDVPRVGAFAVSGDSFDDQGNVIAGVLVDHLVDHEFGEVLDRFLATTRDEVYEPLEA
jgi:hypothetical protein